MLALRLSLIAALGVLFSGLGGCSSFQTSPPKRLADSGAYLNATHYNIEVTAADSQKIRFTVYQPRLKKGSTAPLLIHAHGFALGRMPRPVSLYGKMLLAGKVSIDAWKQGYWVISYDQRGFGASEGMVSLISPEVEGADVSRIIDWAAGNLALTLKGNDPLIGMIGESYGGGAQFAATVQDKRIDALVPLTTWFDLDNALFPNGVPKTDWLTFLAMAGYATAPMAMDNHISKSVLSEVFGDGDAELHKKLRQNSLVGHCGLGEGPHADALLIQGFRDVLFPFTHAEQARDCFKRSGRDVRVIGVEDGHLMPGSQWSWGTPIWNVQNKVVCAGKKLPVHGMILNWLNGKLRDDAAALAAVPTYCVTGDAAVDDGLAAALDNSIAAPPADSPAWQPVAKAHVSNALTGWFEWAVQPFDHVGNWLLPARLPKDWQEPSNGWLRPARIPLFTPKEAIWVVGTPHAELTMSDNNKKDAVVFIRVAIWRPGSGSYRILNQQVMPIRAKGPTAFDLGAIKAQIKPGEVLGLIVQGHSNQFRFGGSGLLTHASIQGRIALPLLDHSKVTVANP